MTPLARGLIARLTCWTCAWLWIAGTAAEPADNAPSPATVPADTAMVIVEGVGLDVESARKDAYRAAVRQVLGTLVDSETLVENDQLVTTQERAANARDLFVAAAKDFPANCFQAEALPLADKDVTVKEDVVECRTRIKISARPEKYDEFIGRVVTFLAGGEAFARGDYQLKQMHPSKLIGQRYGFVGVIEQRVIGSLFPGDFGAALAGSFDGLGDSAAVALGQCTAYRAVSAPPPWHDKTIEFRRRSGQRPLVIAVCRTTAPPYRIEWFVIDPSRAKDWWLSMTDLANCLLTAASQQGTLVAECSVSLRGIGIWRTGDGGPEILQTEIFQGGSIGWLALRSSSRCRSPSPRQSSRRA